MATTKNEIYYPDDYTKVADVPEDLKKLAESVDKEVENIKTSSKVTSQDISKIKKEQTEQNTSIESLQTKLEKVEKDLDDYAIHGQETGESIHLTDSSNLECDIQIQGNIKQDGEPTLDTPVKIQTVKDSVKVTSCNANILDLKQLQVYGIAECTIDEKKENEIIATSTQKEGSSYIRFKMELPAGKWYFRRKVELMEGKGTETTGKVSAQTLDWKFIFQLEKTSEKIEFLLEQKTEFYLSLNIKSSVDTNIEKIKIRYFDMMFSKDDVEYIKHNSQSVIVPIQQEIFSRFDRENNKEEQDFIKLVLNGTENYTLLTTTENYLRFQLDSNLTSNLKNGFKIYCENLKVVKQTTSNMVNEEKIVERDISLDNLLQIVILKSRLAEPTVNGLKQYLATNNIIAYCELKEPTKVDLTTGQIQALEEIDKIRTYKNITNITTDSIAILDADYKKDLETYQKNQDSRITALEELLSTTKTSAMLVENLESDLIEEVK